MRAQIVGTLLTAWLVGSQQIFSADVWRPGSPADDAFRFFVSLSARDIHVAAALEAIRPLPIGVDEKRAVLSQMSASKEGERQ